VLARIWGPITINWLSAIYIYYWLLTCKNVKTWIIHTHIMNVNRSFVKQVPLLFW
jgi:hypothetical protein